MPSRTLYAILAASTALIAAQATVIFMFVVAGGPCVWLLALVISLIALQLIIAPLIGFIIYSVTPAVFPLAIICVVLFVGFQAVEESHKKPAVAELAEAQTAWGPEEGNLHARLARLTQAIEEARRRGLGAELVSTAVATKQRWQKLRAAAEVELTTMSSPSRFFSTDVTRLERAISEAQRWQLDADAARALLAKERAKGSESPATQAPADHGRKQQRREAERELKRAMPGWVSKTDVPRLERAISEAAALGLDVSTATDALRKERDAQRGTALSASDFGLAMEGRQLVEVRLRDWPSAGPLGVTLSNTSTLSKDGGIVSIDMNLSVAELRHIVTSAGMACDDIKEKQLLVQRALAAQKQTTAAAPTPPMIAAVLPGGLAARTGVLHLGDLVGTVNGARVVDHVETTQRVKEAVDDLTLLVLRAPHKPVPMGMPVETLPVAQGIPVERQPALDEPPPLKPPPAIAAPLLGVDAAVCPACSKLFDTPWELRYHLDMNRDAKHEEWRASKKKD